jgi:ketosteroid isomerase-like protein
MSEPISFVSFEEGKVYRTFSGVRYAVTARSPQYATFRNEKTGEVERKQITIVYDENRGGDVEVAQPQGKTLKASDDDKPRTIKRKPVVVRFRDGTIYEKNGRTYRKVTEFPDGRRVTGAHLAQPANKKERRKARRGEPYRSRSGAMLRVSGGQIVEVKP